MPNAGAPILAADSARWYCHATQGTAQTPATSVFTPIQFNGADDVDNLGIHDPVTNNTRFNIGLALGWWLVQGYVPFGANNTGTRRADLWLNGVTSVLGSYIATTAQSSAAAFQGVATPAVPIQATAAGDYVELRGWQDSGAGLATVVSGGMRAGMTCVYLGP